MNVKKKEAGNLLPMTVTEGLTVTILPNSKHEFLMSTQDVAKGYGLKPCSLRAQISRNKHEFIEGKHFVKGAAFCNTLPSGSQPHQTLWTKRGVVRIGFFIKTERAKLFRDWVENLVLEVVSKPIPSLPEAPTRKHNRLTQERLISILADVCQIDDKGLRMSITNKLLEQPLN